ncbi:MAG: glycosyltransferase family 2 protein [Bacteroidales bacterium]|nr:glycosyltransferase family 2 protein [Bacteroidales bacterium]
MPKISIIVPIYKVEKYLRRCLDSIAAQTFIDWECILIDDGSPDDSGKICDEYAEKDGRFRVIHQNNQGVSAARNAGIDCASGEWIGFVDSDDWIEKETYEVAYNSAVQEGVNVICYGMNFYKNGKFSNPPFKDKGDIFYKFQHYRVYMHSLCNKLIRKELIGNKRLNVKMKAYEDLLFIFDVFTEKQVKIIFIKRQLYFYFQANENSSCHILNSQIQLDALRQVYLAIKAIYEAKNINNKFATKYLHFLNACAALPYINNPSHFCPNKFREICIKWNFYSYNPKIFLQFLFAFLKMDFFSEIIMRAKIYIKHTADS